MRVHKRFLFTIPLTVFCLSFSLSAYAFVIRSIQIQGLQGISESTVRSYLPIHEGQEYFSR